MPAIVPYCGPPPLPVALIFRHRRGSVPSEAKTRACGRRLPPLVSSRVVCAPGVCPLRLSGQHLDPEENANGGGKKGQKYDAGQVALRRYGRELGIDQIELVLNFVKIDAQEAIF